MKKNVLNRYSVDYEKDSEEWGNYVQTLPFEKVKQFLAEKDSKETFEAKGNYSNFVNKRTGDFYDWFKGKESLISQANRQISVANGVKIRWDFNDPVSMKAVKKLLNGKVHGIEFVLKPMK